MIGLHLVAALSSAGNGTSCITPQGVLSATTEFFQTSRYIIFSGKRFRRGPFPLAYFEIVFPSGHEHMSLVERGHRHPFSTLPLRAHRLHEFWSSAESMASGISSVFSLHNSVVHVRGHESGGVKLP